MFDWETYKVMDEKQRRLAEEVSELQNRIKVLENDVGSLRGELNRELDREFVREFDREDKERRRRLWVYTVLAWAIGVGLTAAFIWVQGRWGWMWASLVAGVIFILIAVVSVWEKRMRARGKW